MFIKVNGSLSSLLIHSCTNLVVHGFARANFTLTLKIYCSCINAKPLPNVNIFVFSSF